MSGGFILPAAVPSGGLQWQTVDWLDDAHPSPAAGADGTATLELPLDPAVLWLVTHMVCSSTSTAPTTFRLYAGSIGPSGFRDGSDRGNFDVADWPGDGLMFRGSRGSLFAQWTGGDAGTVGTITLQARVMRQVAG